jgi:ring-1,2-phenylacetyl-CoA epoxidase subunit PaaD
VSPIATQVTPIAGPEPDVATPEPDAAAVRAALAEVVDPEIPVISIVDLGMVDEVALGRDAIRVVLLPTFVGCPALELIRSAVEARLRAFGRRVDVSFEYRVPWTTDRISPRGRRRLAQAGIAPPGSQPMEPAGGLIALERPVACPHCGSTRTVLENAFGSTQCRTIRHCAACRQPFEAIKPV